MADRAASGEIVEFAEMPDNNMTSVNNSSEHDKYLEPMRSMEVGNKILDPHETHNWVEITEDFKTAAKTLNLGELLHDNMFGLFEAMSAIEMMDPKMDAGMSNRDLSPPRTFDDMVKSGALKLDNVPYSECIGIIDMTLACLVSWLEGHSLAQTVFTNLYLHQPQRIQDKVMKAFAISIYKIIDIFKICIDKAWVFEEEDFQTMSCGYKLKPDVSESKTIAALKEVEEDLQKKIRSKAVDVSQGVNQETISALHARIKFMRLLYQVFLSLNKNDSGAAGLGETQKLLGSCLDTLQVIQKTVGLGVELTDGHPMLGFDPLVNQRLLPPTFPRYTKVKSRVDALDYLDELINRLKVAFRITSCTSYHSALESFIEFSRYGPCILSRSIMQYLYVSLSAPSYSPLSFLTFGGENCVDVLREAARSFIAPPSLLPKSPLLSNPQARDYVNSFLVRCVRPFGSLIQLSGHNRARQRDKLAHLLEDLAGLQDEAERVDAYLHNISVKNDMARAHLACFGTWVLYYTLRVMIMYLLAGLELELYSTHEYTYIFWYLYEFLYGWIVSALTRANSHVMEQELFLDQQGKGRSAKKNKPKKKKTQPFGREMALNQALQNMCGGYYKAMAAFKIDGKIRAVNPEFDNEQVRYEHRFAPFACLLTPPPVQYAEFRDACAIFQNAAPTSVYLEGCKHFHTARNLLETIPSPDSEVLELLKICKTNFVVLKLLADGHKKETKAPPVFEFKSHPHFPIIRLV